MPQAAVHMIAGKHSFEWFFISGDRSELTLAGTFLVLLADYTRAQN